MSSTSPDDFRSRGPTVVRPSVDASMQRWWLAPLVLLVMLALTVLAAFYVVNATRTEDRLRFQKSAQNAVREVRDIIAGRVEASVDLLRGDSGLFAADPDVTAAAFHAYLERIDLAHNYSSVRAVGFIERIPQSAVEARTRVLQQSGAPAFHVWPVKNSGEDYLSTVYLEPPERSRSALGFDMASQPDRNLAMQVARDTGVPAGTGKIHLLQVDNEAPRQGLVIFVPVYRGGQTPASIEDRRRLLAGYVYGGFRADTLLTGITDNEADSSVDFAIYDGVALTPDNLLFQSIPSPKAANEPGWIAANPLPPQKVDIAGHTWTLTCQAHPEFAPRTGWFAGSLVLLCGAFIAISLFLLTRVQDRARAAAEQSEADLRRSQEALRHSESRLRRLVDSNIIGVVIADDTGRIVEANDAFLRLVGHDRAAIRSGALQWPPEAWRDQLASAADAEESKPRELELQRTDGAIVPVLVGFASLGDGGNLQAGFIIDLTERNRGEAERSRLLASAQAARAEAESANRSKDEFLATLSHELRTPLNAILGWAQLLRMGGLDTDETLRGLETIERNAKVQAQLVEDLLDLSRIISGKLRLTLQPIELAPVVEAALDSVGPAAIAKGIVLLPVLDAHASPVLGDADRLQQVVWNLLSNAIKFTPRGGTIELLLQKVDNEAHIAVTDSGQGIEPEFLPYVFDRLRQADGSSTRRHGGLGLGLAIVRHLVELHGGTVRASSRGQGKGSTFLVALPIAVVSSDEMTPRSSAEGDGAGASALSGVRVLVVDDEVDARELVKHVLQRGGAEVIAVDSVPAAMEAMQRVRPDVLISDISMPGEDGYALLRHVRERQHESRNMPAIALTAFARNEDRQRALQAGFALHVAKPFDPTDLVAAVARLVRLHKPG